MAEIKAELWQRMHLPVPVQGAWLRSVVLGHYRYYGVPHNAKALQRFRKEVAKLDQRAHLLLQTRVRVLNGELADIFKQLVSGPRYEG